MNKLFIDDRAIEFIRKALIREKASSMRIFTGGGGCCKQFELKPVAKALTGDVTISQNGVTIHIEKDIADNIGTLWIKLNEQKGLLIEFE